MGRKCPDLVQASEEASARRVHGSSVNPLPSSARLMCPSGGENMDGSHRTEVTCPRSSAHRGQSRSECGLLDSKAFVLNYYSLQQSFPLPHALVLVEKGGGEPGKTTGLGKKFVHAFL